MASLLTLLLIVTACFLVGVICVLLFRYRKISARRDIRLGKEEVLGRLFLRKIRSIGEAGEDPAATLRSLSALMRSFFSELFDISYEFDYVELNEELGRKGADEKIRKGIIDYSMKTEEFQYGGKALSEEDLSSIIEKSVIIIRSVTEKRPESEAPPAPPAAKDVPEAQVPEAAEKKPGRFSSAIEGFIRKPLPEKREEAPPEEEEAPGRMEADVPVRAVAPTAVRRPVPAPAAAERKPAATVPASRDGKMQRMRMLLVKAEGAIASANAGGAAEAYSELRGIYENLAQDEKRDMQEETHRIIALYNALLGEYKSSLSTSSKPG
ncbi:MAG: hypothetical protein V1813_03460 [Candidatus Aenigmatarchaeota archaeon]